MSNFFLVKAKVTHTEYIAVKASDEEAAEYIAAGVIAGVIDADDNENQDFVANLDCSDFEIEDSEAVDMTKTSDMNAAVDDFCDYLEICVYDAEDDVLEHNENESEEYFSD